MPGSQDCLSLWAEFQRKDSGAQVRLPKWGTVVGGCFSIPQRDEAWRVPKSGVPLGASGKRYYWRCP